MTMSPPVRNRAPRAVDLDAPSAPESAPTQPSKVGAVGYVTTQRTNYYGQEHQHMEEVRVPVFHPQPARVRVGGSVTQNLGDYNSARVEVSIEMPCLPETSEVERVYLMLSEQVDVMLRRELEIATGVPPASVDVPSTGTMN
ncbi:hypothetical protein [Paracoccus sp. MKU1]|uniref:hypothetical protein n=1 Tax=Paracoccus sp. MKU1 TaxID=1745182 RepID=UPI0007192CAC|nr:hypothetical protein [Paracoccus sp. MKU1]KRW94272.1 hypothetical protein AQY21_20290 [Paracoccus sp. MKU1]